VRLAVATPHRRLRSRLQAALPLLLAIACSGPEPEDAGDVEVVASVRNELSIPVGVVWLHLYGTSAGGTLVDLWVKTVPSSIVAFLGVPAGTYRVEGAAYRDPRAQKRTPNPDFLTPAPVVAQVLSKKITVVSLVLQQNVAVHPPATVVNAAPAILSIVASAPEIDPTDPGAAVALAASVADANDAVASLTPSWTAAYDPPLGSIPPGTFTAPGALATSWAPPAAYEGTATLTLTVKDPLGATSAQAVELAVTPTAAKGTLVVTVRVNNFPDVLALTTAQGSVAPLASTSLEVTAADADHDALRYAWSDGGCGGSFATPTARTTAWIAPALVGPCVISVTVTDWTTVAPAAPRGGTNTARLTIQVAIPSSAFAPQLLYATQAPPSPVPAGTAVRFRVLVVEPLAGGGTAPVTALAWSDGPGGTFTPIAGALDYVAWTPPPCAAPGVASHTVTLTATGAPPASAQSVFPFDVTIACP
jgi:hypothetical protein